MTTICNDKVGGFSVVGREIAQRCKMARAAEVWKAGGRKIAGGKYAERSNAAVYVSTESL